MSTHLLAVVGLAAVEPDGLVVLYGDGKGGEAGVLGLRRHEAAGEAAGEGQARRLEAGLHDRVRLGEVVELDGVADGRLDVGRAVGEAVLADIDADRLGAGNGGAGDEEGVGKVHCE